LKYEVRLSKRVDRELASLEQSKRSRIVERLEELRDDPSSRRGKAPGKGGRLPD
jgi:mRNA-degrading endonuclease RelE of RelBE toxin-antitoxin system